MQHLLQTLIWSLQLLSVSFGVVILFVILLIAASSSEATERIISVIDALRHLYNASNDGKNQQSRKRRRGH